MSWQSSRRDISGWPSPWPKTNFVFCVYEICTPAHRPDAAIYHESYVGRGFGGHLCVPAVAAGATQGGQYSGVKITAIKTGNSCRQFHASTASTGAKCAD